MIPESHLSSGREDESRPNLVFGALSELRAAELLIERGHRVAKPIVDDFGVDLIVDYDRKPITVQVKATRTNATARRVNSSPIWQFRPLTVAPTAAIVMFHVRPIDAWWIVPAEEIVLGKSIRMIERRLRATRSDAAHDFDPWRDRWDLFNVKEQPSMTVLEDST